MTENIFFPHLHIYLHNVGKSISIGGFTIAYYGLIIACGMILATIMVRQIARRTGQDPDDYLNLAIMGIIISVIGARIYYVVFSWDLYKDHPIDILNLRQGGLAIYGGVIGAVLSAILYAKIKKIKLGLLVDTAAPGLILGQIIGRWGNFFNREAFGAETASFLRMGLTTPEGETIYVHPTFLYESVWNLIGLFFLIIFTKKHRNRYDGQCFLIYLFWYGLGRAWIEGLRTDSLYLGSTGIRISQLLSILLVLIAGVLLILGRKKKWHRTTKTS